MKSFISIFALILFTIGSINAATLDGISMPDTKKLGGKTLLLNGQGTRKATWLKVKVYVGGLYLEKKSDNAESFLNDGKTKYLVMHFVRDVRANKLKEGWQEALMNSTKGKDALRKAIYDRYQKFVNLMQDINEGEKIVLLFNKDNVQVKVKGGKPVKFKGADFVEGLLAVWFRNAKDVGLRDGLLGKN